MIEDLIGALLDDVRQEFVRDLPVALRDGAGQGDELSGLDHRLVCAAELFLQAIGIGGRYAEPVNDVGGDILAAEVDCGDMADLALEKYGQVGGPGAHLDKHHAELFLVVGERRKGAREWCEHEIFRLVSRLLDRFPDVVRR